jgi:Mrp family chromosome partitioning ATPase
MAEVGELFDYVIVDTPPLDQHSDAAIVAGVAGNALVVARIHKTKSGALRRAVHMLRVINVRVIGAVVTGEPSRRQGRSRNSDRRRVGVSREKLTT